MNKQEYLKKLNELDEEVQEVVKEFRKSIMSDEKELKAWITIEDEFEAYW